jgi:4-hydroxy-4-methyl-2-oxoglutarate aldolase
MTIEKFQIGAFPAQLPRDAAEKLRAIEAATVGHYLNDRFMDPEIRPIIDDRRIAGTAVTVSIAGADSAMLYYAMDRVRPGDVLVIDRCGDTRHACWGGFMAAVARKRELAGVIIDGCVCDPVEVRQQGVPTWARSVSALTTKLYYQGGSLNHPVSCGGVSVSPGDTIIADDCGIVVLPLSMVASVTEVSLAEQAEEGDWLAHVEAGGMLNDLVDVASIIEGRKDA